MSIVIVNSVLKLIYHRKIFAGNLYQRIRRWSYRWGGGKPASGGLQREQCHQLLHDGARQREDHRRREGRPRQQVHQPLVLAEFAHGKVAGEWRDADRYFRYAVSVFVIKLLIIIVSINIKNGLRKNLILNVIIESHSSIGCLDGFSVFIIHTYR